nr:immunoglobulin light chain junction region [Macaca mulatta]MOW01649.1 immunoglobulin light chain junction region [Macaca mulatta]
DYFCCSYTTRGTFVF